MAGRFLCKTLSHGDRRVAALTPGDHHARVIVHIPLGKIPHRVRGLDPIAPQMNED
jgi:hypothetical protein